MADTATLIERQLIGEFGDLYRCLLIKTSGKTWKLDDIGNNDASFVTSMDAAPGAVKKLCDRLAKPRQYKVRGEVHQADAY